MPFSDKDRIAWGQRVLEESRTILQVFLKKTIPVRTAIDRIAQLPFALRELPQDTTQQDLDNVFYYIWQPYIDQIQTEQDTSLSIIELLIAISNLPNLLLQEQPAKVFGWQVWEELPGFHTSFRDAWDSVVYWRTSEPVLSERPTKYQHYINMSAFCAHAQVHIPRGHKCLGRRQDCSGFADVYAIWSFKLALEDDRRQAQYERLSSIRELSVEIIAAANFIVIAGSAIYDDLVNGQKGDDFVRDIRGGELWTGSPGYSLKRWVFWRERFQMYAVSPSLEEEAREIAKSAVNEMDAISTS